MQSLLEKNIGNRRIEMNAFEAFGNNIKLEDEPAKVTKPRILSDEERYTMKKCLAETGGDITYWTSQNIIDLSFDAEMQRWIHDNKVKLHKDS
jgi:hypothetical protein